jgi:hypothetical protein
VRNLRAALSCELTVGRRVERLRAVELQDEDKIPVLRSYLARWRAEVWVFFDGRGASSSDADLMEIAPRHPVFRLETI